MLIEVAPPFPKCTVPGASEGSERIGTGSDDPLHWSLASWRETNFNVKGAGRFSGWAETRRGGIFEEEILESRRG